MNNPNPRLDPFNPNNDIYRHAPASTNAAIGERNIKKCHFCSKTSETNLATCGRCKMVAYCNRQCQKKDWKKHKKECNDYLQTKKTCRVLEKEVKALTGKSKHESRKELENFYKELNNLDGFREAMVNISHMIMMGKNNLPEIGIVEPTPCLFRVNSTAFEEFSKSAYSHIKTTIVLTVCPFEHLEVIVPESFASTLRENYYKDSSPINLETGGCMWYAAPDVYEAGCNQNMVNFLPFPGTKHTLNRDEQMDYGTESFMRIAFMKNMLLSRALRLNGAGQVPSDLMAIVAEDLPNWKALANSSKFNSIVSKKSFGVMTRKMNNSKRSSKTAVVTLFVNALLLKEISEYYIKDIEKQLEESERNGLSMYDLINKTLLGHQLAAMGRNKEKQGPGGKGKK